MNTSKKNYHHGDLKNALMSEGIFMINECGIENFSFNKLAKKCSVTPPAIYSHFESKDDLLNAIKEKVLEDFELFLFRTPRYPSGGYDILEFGLNYIKFFVSNPHYFYFLWKFSDKPINLDNIHCPDNPVPFLMFKDSVLKIPEYQQLPELRLVQSILSKWAMVIGLCYTIINNHSIYSGDYLSMCRKVLLENLVM